MASKIGDLPQGNYIPGQLENIYQIKHGLEELKQLEAAMLMKIKENENHIRDNMQKIKAVEDESWVLPLILLVQRTWKSISDRIFY